MSDKSNKGLLVLRVGLGGMFMYHGLSKFFGGVKILMFVGSAVSNFGIHGGFLFWGIMSACAETFGGLFLILGMYFPVVCSFLVINLIVATITVLQKSHKFLLATQPIEDGIVFFSLIFIGPGELTIRKVFRRFSRTSLKP
ncbi:MAG: DoxX family protein [Candidatus Omnitrophica bacterium]|nr:DoxX family protein [Candidatus Omnitrophota bacterium]